MTCSHENNHAAKECPRHLNGVRASYSKEYIAVLKMLSSLNPQSFSWLCSRQYWQEPSEQLPAKPVQFPKPAAASSSTDQPCPHWGCVAEMLLKQPAKKPSCSRVKLWKSRLRCCNQQYRLLLVLSVVLGFALYSFLSFFGGKKVNEAGSGDKAATRTSGTLKHAIKEIAA